MEWVTLQNIKIFNTNVGGNHLEKTNGCVEETDGKDGEIVLLLSQIGQLAVDFDFFYQVLEKQTDQEKERQNKIVMEKFGLSEDFGKDEEDQLSPKKRNDLRKEADQVLLFNSRGIRRLKFDFKHFRFSALYTEAEMASILEMRERPDLISLVFIRETRQKTTHIEFLKFETKGSDYYLCSVDVALAFSLFTPLSLGHKDRFLSVMNGVKSVLMDEVPDNPVEGLWWFPLLYAALVVLFAVATVLLN